MKFSCYKADLPEALKFVLNAVAVKPTIPVLSGVYLKAQNSTLELQGNNLSTGIVTHIPASVGRNIRTGETIQLPATRRVSFKQGKPLKEAVQ